MFVRPSGFAGFEKTRTRPPWDATIEAWQIGSGRAGSRVTALLGAGGTSILTALSAGTFLYVSLCELLPEVFHRRQDGPLKISLLLIGVAAMWYVHAIGGI